MSIVSQIFAQFVSKNDSNNRLKKTIIAKSSQKDDFHSTLSRRWIFFTNIKHRSGNIWNFGLVKINFYDFKVKTKNITFAWKSAFFRMTNIYSVICFTIDILSVVEFTRQLAKFSSWRNGCWWGTRPQISSCPQWPNQIIHRS